MNFLAFFFAVSKVTEVGRSYDGWELLITIVLAVVEVVEVGLVGGNYARRRRSSMSTRQMSSMVLSSTRSLVEWGSTMRGPMLAIWMPG